MFHNLARFLSAFMIYISIRATFGPEYGSTMSIWVERIIGYNAKGSWPSVLINFFQRHQTAPAAKWLEIDGELVALHFTFANSAPNLAHTPKSDQDSHPSPRPERCKKFNRSNGWTFPASHTQWPHIPAFACLLGLWRRKPCIHKLHYQTWPTSFQ